MPGPSNADNKFGLSPFIVGTVLGDGCNYTSIQTAINDATATGGGNVLIRFGNYAENITTAANVNLMGFSGSTLVNGGTSISGTVTASHNGICTISCLALLNAVGTPLQVIGANTTVLICDNVLVQANAADTFLCNAPNCAVGFINCFLSQDGAFKHIDIVDGDVSLRSSLLISLSALAINSTIADGVINIGNCNCACGFDISGTGNLNSQISRIASNTGLAIDMSSSGQAEFFNCGIEGFNPNEAINIALGSEVFCSSCNIISNAANAVIGSGTFRYDIVTFSATSSTFAGTIIEAIQVTRPIATATERGLARFDATDFSVTNGLVELNGFPQVSFTPTAIGGTVAGVTTYVVQQGFYAVIGDYVWINMVVTWSAATGTGNIVIGNLPFTVVAAGGSPAASGSVEGAAYTWPVGSTMTSFQFQGGTTTALIRGLGSTTNSQIFQMQNTTTGIQLTGIYRIV